MKLRVDQIVADRGVQSRLGLDEATVREYAEVYRAAREAGEDAPFPRVVVFTFDASAPDPVYWLADGYHRLAGAQAADVEWIACDVRAGGKRAAMLHSLGANAEHGLRRSAEDKRKAVRMLLEDAEFGQWSNRAIAEHARVSAMFVCKIRNELNDSKNLSNVNVYVTATNPINNDVKESGGEFPTCTKGDGDGENNDTNHDDRARAGESRSTGGADSPSDSGIAEAGSAAAAQVADEEGGITIQGLEAIEEKGLTVRVLPPRRGHGRNYEFELRQVWTAVSSYLASVPEAERHYICGQLENLRADFDPEFVQTQQANRKFYEAQATKKSRRGGKRK